MAEGKKSCIIYADQVHTVRKMSKSDAGELFLHILEYINDNDPVTDNAIVELCFEPIKQQFKRDLRKWEEIKEKRSVAGKASAEKRQHMLTHVESVEQTSTNPTVTVNDTVTVNVTVKEDIYTEGIEPDKSDSGKKNKKASRLPKKEFVPPGFEEFEKYCQDNGFKNIAERAFKGYSENNWHDSRGHPVLNWKSKLQNVWFNPNNKDSNQLPISTHSHNGTFKPVTGYDKLKAAADEARRLDEENITKPAAGRENDRGIIHLPPD